jgi:hypothetical protein
MKRKRPVWDDEARPTKVTKTDVLRRDIAREIDREVCGNYVQSIIDNEYQAMLWEEMIISVEDKFRTTTNPKLRKYLPRELLGMKSGQDKMFGNIEKNIDLVRISS